MDPVLKCRVSRVGGIKSSQGAQRGVEKRGFLLLKALDSFKQSRGKMALLLRPTSGWATRQGLTEAVSDAVAQLDRGSAGRMLQLPFCPQCSGAVVLSGVREADAQIHHPGASESKTRG